MNKRQKKRLAKLLCYLVNLHGDPVEWDSDVYNEVDSYCIRQLKKHGFKKDALGIACYEKAVEYILLEARDE